MYYKTRSWVRRRGTTHQPFGQNGGSRPVPRVFYEAPPSPSSQLAVQPPATRQFGVPQPVAPQAMATALLNGVNIKVINRDIVNFITSEHVQAVVNAANSESFIPGDDGISGALRDAMYSRPIYQGCVKMKHAGTLEDERQSLDARIKLAKMHSDAENPVCGSMKYLKTTFDISSQVKLLTETQAAWEPTKGYLKASGVEFVIHAVGPKWTNPKYQFEQCASKLKETIKNALALAESLQVTSIAFPLISGGIFCHPHDPLREQEQAKAQEVLLEVILAHVKKTNQQSTLKNIFIVEIDRELSQHMAVKVQSIAELQLRRMRELTGRT
jgi:O-acetyl-ADP-ribose deacetylase (regulator of RNase III)